MGTRDYPDFAGIAFKGKEIRRILLQKRKSKNPSFEVAFEIADGGMERYTACTIECVGGSVLNFHFLPDIEEPFSYITRTGFNRRDGCCDFKKVV